MTKIEILIHSVLPRVFLLKIMDKKTTYKTYFYFCLFPTINTKLTYVLFNSLIINK